MKTPWQILEISNNKQANITQYRTPKTEHPEAHQNQGCKCKLEENKSITVSQIVMRP